MWGDNSLWFWFAFLWWLKMLSIFSCICWLSICVLWKKCLFRSFAHFNFSLMFSWVSHLYIFDIKCSSVISFANIFSHLKIVLLFCWWFVLLWKKKLGPFVYFSFVSFAWGDRSKYKYCYDFYQYPAYVFF